MTDLPPLLIVTGSLAAERGGQERSVREYAQALAALGCGIHVLAAGLPEPVPWAAAATGDAVRASRSRRALLGARSVIDTWPGVVQTMLPLPGADLYVPRGGLQRDACAASVASRSSALGRGLAVAGSLLALRRRDLCRREDALLHDPQGPLLVAISDLVAGQMRRRGVDAARIRVVPNGVALDRGAVQRVDRRAVRKRLGVEDGCVLLLALAVNHRLKGVADLRRAIADLATDVPLQLLVAGGPAAPDAAGGRMRFLGRRDDVTELLAAADALVHATYYDPASRAVLEAIGAGLPVLTTRHDGSAARVAKGAGCVLESAGDLPALRRGLHQLLDSRVRAAWTAAARAAPVDVSMARHARLMADVIREAGVRKTQGPGRHAAGV